MAAIWRAFLILGNRLCGIPDEETRLLRELQDLYKRRISLNSPASDTMGSSDRRDNSEDHHTSDGRDTTYRFPSMAQNEESAGFSSGGLQHSALQESGPRGREHATCSFADSAIDLESETSKGQTQGRLPNTLPKHRIRNSTTRTIQKDCRGLLKLTRPRGHLRSFAPSHSAGVLPGHRPRSNLLERQRWEWGPTSSSGDKIEQHVRTKRRKMQNLSS